MNKKLILILIGFLWVGVALAMIASKNYTLRTGKTVLLETVPVDPRDFLRGDYVVLRYKISDLDLSKIKTEKPHYSYGENIYVILKPGDKFWEAVAIQKNKSAAESEVIIKGKAGYSGRKELGVRYGIESYFVPEGQGRDIERSMRGNKSSVTVEALVDSSGNALIKNVYVEK